MANNTRFLTFKYTAVIRTLGTAGEKYLQLLESLYSQSIPPEEVIVYIAKGYSIPVGTKNYEKYVFVDKGMVAQRALQYKEVHTDWILFLDDDLWLESDTVEQMFYRLNLMNADVIAPDVFHNADRSLGAELLMMASGRMWPRRNDNQWGYKVMRTAGYSYNKRVHDGVRCSQTNAGACFLCKKDTFLSIRFEEELWLDAVPYALGDDQVMFYKMYCRGYKILTWYDHKVLHLDAGQNLTPEKAKTVIYSDFRFKSIFWHRFIFMPEPHFYMKLWSVLCIMYALIFSLTVSIMKLRFDILKIKTNAIKDALKYMHSIEYRSLPLI